MRVDSAGAAFCGAFISSLSGNLFADELGGPDSIAYKSLQETYLMGYSALHDHLTERCKNSPFWRGKRSKFLPKPYWTRSAFWRNAAAKTPEHGSGENCILTTGKPRAPNLRIIWVLLKRRASSYSPVILTEVHTPRPVTIPRSMLRGLCRSVSPECRPRPVRFWQEFQIAIHRWDCCFYTFRSSGHARLVAHAIRCLKQFDTRWNQVLEISSAKRFPLSEEMNAPQERPRPRSLHAYCGKITAPPLFPRPDVFFRIFPRGCHFF